MAEFADEVKKWEKKTADKLDLATRQIALQIFSRIIIKSPVDTGRFRGNWQLAIGSAPDGTLELDDKTGTATITKGTATSLGVNAGDIIYFANNLPYAQRLETGGYPDGPKVVNGHSSQAPNGMVALTVQEFKSIVAAIGIELSFT